MLGALQSPLACLIGPWSLSTAMIQSVRNPTNILWLPLHHNQYALSILVSMLLAFVAFLELKYSLMLKPRLVELNTKNENSSISSQPSSGWGDGHVRFFKPGIGHWADAFAVVDWGTWSKCGLLSDPDRPISSKLTERGVGDNQHFVLMRSQQNSFNSFYKETLDS